VRAFGRGSGHGASRTQGYSSNAAPTSTKPSSASPAASSASGNSTATLLEALRLPRGSRGPVRSQQRDQRDSLALAQARSCFRVWDLAACEGAGRSRRPEAGKCEEEIGDLGGRRERGRVPQHVLDPCAAGCELVLQRRPGRADLVCAAERAHTLLAR